ncbi:hypothetical protein P9112_010407 [Eukaryota sp. TZLM1-RC]
MLDVILVVFNASIPTLVVIMLGFIAIWYKVLKPCAISEINSFLYRFCVPGLLFNLISTIDLSVVEPLFIWALLVFKASSFLLSLLSCSVAAKLGFKLPLNQSIFVVWSSFAWTNTVIFGIPISTAMFGDMAARYCAIGGAINSLLHIPTSILLSESGAGPKKGSKKRLLKAVLLNKSIMAVALALMFAGFGIPMPEFVSTSIQYLSSTVTGTSLFSIGMFMAARIMDKRKFDANKYDLDTAEGKSSRSQATKQSSESDAEASEDSEEKSPSNSDNDSVEKEPQEKEEVSLAETTKERPLPLDDGFSYHQLSYCEQLELTNGGKYFLGLLMFLRLVAAPFLMLAVLQLFNVDVFVRDVLLFLHLLPNALTVFTLAKEYDICTALLNKVVLYANLGLPVVLLVYTFAFDFTLQ